MRISMGWEGNGNQDYDKLLNEYFIKNPLNTYFGKLIAVAFFGVIENFKIPYLKKEIQGIFNAPPSIELELENANFP